MRNLVKLRSGMVLVAATVLSSVAAFLFAPLFAPVFAQLSARLTPDSSGRTSAQVAAQPGTQNRGSSPDKTQNHATVMSLPRNPAEVLDARRIMSQSVVATEHSWQARDQFTYTELDEDKRLDSQGQVKSEN